MLITTGDQTPLIPLGEVEFNTGAVFPEHNVSVGAKSGVILAVVTLTIKVKLLAHCPGFGVKRYVPLFILSITAGDQTPVIPLGEVAFKAGAAVPEHNVNVGEKSGTTVAAVTVTVKVKLLAHCPAVGVKR